MIGDEYGKSSASNSIFPAVITLYFPVDPEFTDWLFAAKANPAVAKVPTGPAAEVPSQAALIENNSSQSLPDTRNSSGATRGGSVQSTCTKSVVDLLSLLTFDVPAGPMLNHGL